MAIAFGGWDDYWTQTFLFQKRSGKRFSRIKALGGKKNIDGNSDGFPCWEFNGKTLVKCHHKIWVFHSFPKLNVWLRLGTLFLKGITH